MIHGWFASNEYVQSSDVIAHKLIEFKQELIDHPRVISKFYDNAMLIEHFYISHNEHLIKPIITSEHISHIIKKHWCYSENENEFIIDFVDLMTFDHVSFLLQSDTEISTLITMCRLLPFKIKSSWTDGDFDYLEFYDDDDPIVHLVNLLNGSTINIQQLASQPLIYHVTCDQLLLILQSGKTVKREWLPDDWIIPCLKYLRDDPLTYIFDVCNDGTYIPDIPNTIPNIQLKIIDSFQKKLTNLEEWAAGVLGIVILDRPLCLTDDLIRELKLSIDYYESLVTLHSTV